VDSGSNLLLAGNIAGRVFENWNGDLEHRGFGTPTMKDRSCYTGQCKDNNVIYHNTNGLFNQCVVEKGFAGAEMYRRGYY